MTDIFLSYNREDQAIARHFAEGFERAGFSVWWDVTLKSGEDFDQVTEQALEVAKAVVVLWSKKSVASRWVRAEATQADRNKTLVPVTIEPCKRPIMFELKQTADLSHWDGDADDPVWLSFVSDVQQFVMRDRPAGAVDNTPTPITAMRKQSKSNKSLALRHAWLVAAAAILVVVMLAIPTLQHLREEAPPEL
ncbi:MAG: toll/interleukin-1 receptor domain-containing protein, partial [Pseudomonadota bacterium]